MSTGSTKLPWFGTGWKMTKTRSQAVEYANEVVLKAPAFVDRVNCFVLPAFPLIDPVVAAMGDSGIKVGAQNVHWEDSGAFTGEVSAPMLSEIGVTLCCIGHAERRQLFGETDDTVRLRTAAAIRNGITPLVCVGESAAIRADGSHVGFVESQVEAAMSGLAPDQVAKTMLAYEPVWAIGEGSTPATAEQADEMHSVIRRTLIRRHEEAGESVPLLYGGSVDTGSAHALIEAPHVDGLFVGRAAWSASGFIELATIVASAGG